MALTNPNIIVDTTFSSKNIASAASVYTYTAATSGIVYINVKLTNAAGNGDYIIYLKKQWLGTGTASTMIPKTTATAATGETVIEFPSIAIFVKATDVLDIYIDGLAGDTSVNGNIQIVADNFSVFQAGDTVTNVTNVANATITAGSVDAIWDEQLTAAAHNVPNSSGRRLRQLSSATVDDGTLQSGGNGVNIVQLALTAPSTSIDPSVIVFTKGTDAQVGKCTQYDGTTKLATLRRGLKTPVDNTWDYLVFAAEGGMPTNDGLLQGGGTTWAYLNTLANTQTDVYKNQLLYITSDSTTEDTVRVITTSYVEAGKVKVEWINPIPTGIDSSTSYEIIPSYVNLPSENATAVWSSGTRTLSAFGFTVATNSDSNITAIKAKTDNLPVNPASQTNLDVAVSTRSSLTASQVWSNPTRTLTSGGGSGGATAQEIWEYSNRTLTGWNAVIDLFWSKIPNWIKNQLDTITDDREIYRGVTNEIVYTDTLDINGASDIIFTMKNNYTDSDNNAIIQIYQTKGLAVLNGVSPYSSPTNGSIVITSQTNGNFSINIEYPASNELISLVNKPYDIKAIVGNKVKLVKRGKMTILPDVSNLDSQ